MRRSVLTVLVLLSAACQRHAATDLLLGTVEYDRIELIAEASEPITEIAVREGQEVAAGALILRLDPRRADVAVAAAKAEIARLNAVLAEQHNGPRPENISEARARVARAASLELNANQDLERARKMRERGLNATADLDRAQASAKAAKAERDAAAAALAALTAGTRVEEIAASEAMLDGARAKLAAAELDRQRLDVVAPRAGRVDSIPVRRGDQPARGANLAVLLAGDAPFARVYVPAPLRAGLKEGDEFDVTVEGLAQPIRGRLRHVDADAAFTPYYALSGDDASRLSFRAEIDLVGDGAKALPSGLPVNVRLGSRSAAK